MVAILIVVRREGLMWELSPMNSQMPLQCYLAKDKTFHVCYTVPLGFLSGIGMTKLYIQPKAK